MNESYSEAYRTLYERHWWWRARERVIAEVLASHAPPEGFARALDVGCGDGLLFPVLARFAHDVEGVEPFAPVRGDPTAAHGTIHRVPFDDRFAPGLSFSLVVMLDVLEHLDDDVASLRVVRRLLAPSGLLLITVPAFESLWTRHDDLNEHRRRYTATTLRRACDAAGLRVRHARYLFHWLAPIKLLVRQVERLRPGGVPALPRIPAPPINRLLTSLTRLEFALTRRASPPFGSSLLAVVTRDDDPRTLATASGR